MLELLCLPASWTGTPATISDALPALMANLRMMATMSRYYSALPRLTGLLQKITDQVRCLQVFRF